MQASETTSMPTDSLPQPWVLGLTGGIGSGKSAVATVLQEHGAAIVDTDVIAHALGRPGNTAAQAVARLFGPDYLDDDGAIDRARLRERIFTEPQAKTALEAAVHPLIRAAALEKIKEIGLSAPYIVLVVPLLFETMAYSETIDRSLVVDCDEAIQISRVMARSHLNESMAKAIVASQMPRLQKLTQADDVLENNGDWATLKINAEKLHLKYLQYAESKNICAKHL